MKHILTLLVVIALFCGCASVKDDDETTTETTAETTETVTSETAETTTEETTTETTEITTSETTEETTAETTVNPADLPDTLWETDYFSIVLKGGWEVYSGVWVPSGGYAYYGDETELIIALCTREEYGGGSGDMLTLVTEYYELNDYYHYGFTFEKFGNNGLKSNQGYFIRRNEDSVYHINFSGNTDLFSEDYLEDMVNSFIIKPEPVYDYSVRDVESMNRIAETIMKAIYKWYHVEECAGYYTELDMGFRIRFEVDENGVFTTDYLLNQNPMFFVEPPDAGGDLCRILQRELPGLKSVKIETIIGTVGDAVLVYVSGVVPDVEWDVNGEHQKDFDKRYESRWGYMSWYAPDAIANGIDKNGVMFGTWPPHTIQ